MKITVLASGSKGNATVIDTGNTKLLIDVGLSYKQLSNKLMEKQIDISSIDAILITHEHADHTKGMATLSKRHETDVYLTKGTYDAICKSKYIFIHHDNVNAIDYYEELSVNDVTIKSIPISHDACQPSGFIISNENKKVVYITDTGYVSEDVEAIIKNADAYIIESNHDTELLMMTNRPWHLKKRILSDLGHLCNEDALYVLERVMGDKTKLVLLAHISEEANNRDLLRVSTDQFLKNYTIENDELTIVITEQHEPTETYEI